MLFFHFFLQMSRAPPPVVRPLLLSTPQLHPFAFPAWVAAAADSLTIATTVTSTTAISMAASTTTPYITTSSGRSRSLRLSGGGDPAVPEGSAIALRL